MARLCSSPTVCCSVGGRRPGSERRPTACWVERARGSGCVRVGARRGRARPSSPQPSSSSRPSCLPARAQQVARQGQESTGTGATGGRPWHWPPEAGNASDAGLPWDANTRSRPQITAAAERTRGAAAIGRGGPPLEHGGAALSAWCLAYASARHHVSGQGVRKPQNLATQYRGRRRGPITCLLSLRCAVAVEGSGAPRNSTDEPCTGSVYIYI